MTRALPLFLAFACGLAAQSPGDPLTLIRIVRRNVAPRQPLDVYRAARPPVEVWGMRSMTGASQTIVIEALGTWSMLEAVERALDRVWTREDSHDELIAPSSSLLALYRPSLSFRPDEAVKLMAEARYVQVSIYRMRPGYDMAFAELIALRSAALDRINSDRPELGYQVISGGTTGTYFFVAPLTSLRTYDESFARWTAYADGPVSHGRARREVTAEADITRETLLFRVEGRVQPVAPEVPQ